MTAAVEGPTPPVPAAEADGDPLTAVIFLGVSLILGIASRHLLRGSRVPYTVALLIIGVALGSIEYGTSHRMGKLGAGIRLWAQINPDLLLCVFLPALLFESSFAMEVHQIKRCMVQMLLLAGPGVLISTFFLGAAVKLAFPYKWDWKTSLLLGGLLSATDPVAVVALLKDLGASKKLSTVIEGESLMNDGTAIVVYQLFYQMVLGKSFNAGSVLKFLSQVSLGAVAIGFAFGLLSVLWLGYIFNDTVIEITLTLAVSYIVYFTAQDAAEVSGVLAVMTLGMFYAAVGRTAFKGDSQRSLHHFWEMVAYIANTLIFILSGVVIAEGVLHSDTNFENAGSSWGYLVLLYVLVQASRVVVVGVLYPFLQYFGYGLDWKEAIILIWSGLRGAVALALSLSVKRANIKLYPQYLNQDMGTLFVFFTGGIVFFTLIINGSTTQFILHLLDMSKLSVAKTRLLDYTRYEMLNKALEAFGDLGDDEELGAADWHTVKRYITCLHNLEGRMHPHSISDGESHLHTMNLTEMRVRLLNGVQAAYWGMLEDGRIRQTTAILLMQSIDEAIDTVTDKPLCDWRGLKAHVHFPNYYKYLQMSYCPTKLATYFTVERLESACYICAAFLRAHRIARRQLHEFIGDSEIASIVINESETEGDEARKFLEDVRVSFPQVLLVVKTKQVTYSILQHLIEYVESLEKSGLLEKKEMLELHDGVQTDLKRLLRNPPLVKMPKIKDMFNTHPLLGALPLELRQPLEGFTKDMMKLHGTPLYKEGTKPSGIWLISNGVVKWVGKRLKNKHSLHPTFSHGSTLGLYEVLTGKSYICDMITDSVVHCFFIEAEKIFALVSNSAAEDFLWQESALAVVKILLPQIFEKMSMRDMRTLVAERSTMKTYISGEIIEIGSQVIGFLMEGFVKMQDDMESLVSYPAMLLHNQVDQSCCSEISGSDNSFCYYGQSYKVETRARLIFFEMGPSESNSGVLQRMSSSWILHSHDLPKSHSKDHAGLMSWPESLYRSIQSDQQECGNQRQASNLFQRTVQLSIYGSTMIENCGHDRNSFSNSGAKPSHSYSFPRTPSKTGRRPLLSYKSEGSYIAKCSRTSGEIFGSRSNIRPTTKRRDKVIIDVSSDESGDEVIVRIDSPSSISFRQTSESVSTTQQQEL